MGKYVDNNDKAYYPWVDWMKVFGIYCVILGHYSLVDSTFTHWIYSFHMPLFFILSGFLHKPEKNVKDSLIKSTRTLIVPYLIMNGLCLIYFTVYDCLIDQSFSFSLLLNEVAAIALGLGYKYNTFVPVSLPLWFLIALFFIKLIASISKNTQCHAIFSIASVVISYSLAHFKIDTVVPLDSALLAFPFFCVGIYIKEVLLKISSFQITTRLIITFSLIGLSLLLCFINGFVDINNMLWGSDMLVFYLCGIFSFVSFYMLFRRLPGGAFLRIVSSSTIIVMGFGNIITGRLIGIYRIVSGNYSFPNIIGCIIAVIVLMACVLLTWLFKKYFPIILGYR